METNTIIITSAKTDVSAPATVERVRAFLNDSILSQYEISPSNALQLITLTNFRRLVLIFPTLSLAQRAMSAKNEDKAVDDLQFSYSLVDTDYQDQKQHLDLPPHRKLFLVSPPVSPPPEFDYSRLEESPGRAFEHATHHQIPSAVNAPPEHRVLLDHPIGTITLDYCGGSAAPNGGAELSVEHLRTGMPPRSIFDEDE